MILAQGCRDQNTYCFELYVMYAFEFINEATTAHSGLRKREIVAVFYTAVGESGVSAAMVTVSLVWFPDPSVMRMRITEGSGNQTIVSLTRHFRVPLWRI